MFYSTTSAAQGHDHSARPVARFEQLMSLPKEDILDYRKVLDTITMTMAGASRKITSGDISTGALGDIRRATNMARAICQYLA